MTVQAPRKRSKALDVLRGIAVLLVIITHTGITTSKSIHGEAIPLVPGMKAVQEEGGLFNKVFARVQQMGWSGVDLFFVLSGFLIGGLLLNEMGKSGKIDFPRFWFRRAFKIVPSYYFLLLVLAATGTTSYLARPRSGSVLGSLAVHGLFLQNYLDRLVNEITWSLAVEEHFYLFLPILLLGIGLWNLRNKSEHFRGVPTVLLCFILACLGLRIAAVIFGFHNKDDWIFSHYRIDALFIGVFCQYLWRTRRAAIQKWAARPWPWIGLGALLVSPSMFLLRGHPLMFSLGFFGIACGYAIILMAVIGRGLGRFEDNWLTTSVSAVGRWSYNIYLWHFFLPMTLFHLGISYYADLQLSLNQIPWVPAALIAKTALYAALAIGGGWLVTKTIEEPLLLLRDKVVPRKSPASPLGTDPPA